LRSSSNHIQLTDEAISFIIQHFIKNSGREKSRNISLIFETDKEKQKDDESFKRFFSIYACDDYMLYLLVFNKVELKL
jgi:hypothetical protein